ncbi:hypothetical protein H206_02628 [Candidatus Electrothrix aarhusensis]|uniref:Uncharacterized protein n=1 Tax=Candidatus Electrothrix aarhusensis TaxID=1859131 RepID=A0A3S3QC79_9BACT|nr:hypothetical protein H206_02628 [Candidatus Electrothrix aarhusensis]
MANAANGFTGTYSAIKNQGMLPLKLPPEIKQGRYRAVVIIEEYPARKRTKKAIRFPAFDTEPVDPKNNFRREELY